jgi:hypothetical protein
MVSGEHIREFCWDAFNNWAGYFTGGCITATITFWHSWRNQTMKRKWLLGVTALFFAMAAYRAWNDQYIKVTAANDASDTWRQEVHDSRKTIDLLLVAAVSRTNGSEPKKISWLLPEVDENGPYTIYLGGHYQKHSEFGTPMIYPGSRSVADVFEMGHKQGVPVIMKGGQNESWPVIVARSIGGRACIDVHIATPKAPIEILSGESTALPEGWDWNSDGTAMEVVDDQLRVIFQEEFIPTNQVIVRGDIQHEDVMIEAGFVGWPSEKPHIMLGEMELRRMFLYPSERHKTERNPNYLH